VLETETRPETFETETETQKNGSRDRDQVSRLHDCCKLSWILVLFKNVYPRTSTCKLSPSNCILNTQIMFWIPTGIGTLVGNHWHWWITGKQCV